jgi:hypothetical protein
LLVFDIRDPAHPQWVGGRGTTGNAYGVALAGNYAYVAYGDSGLQVFDVRDPVRPQWAGDYRSTHYARGVAVAGNCAYVADLEVGLLVIDIGDPAHPQRLRGCETTGGALGVAVAGNYAYVSQYDGSLRVVDVANFARDRFHFLVRGEPAQKVRIQRSQNLTDWQDWQEVTLGSGPADVTDADFLSVPRCFYRAVSP